MKTIPELFCITEIEVVGKLHVLPQSYWRSKGYAPACCAISGSSSVLRSAPAVSGAPHRAAPRSAARRWGGAAGPGRGLPLSPSRRQARRAPGSQSARRQRHAGGSAARPRSVPPLALPRVPPLAATSPQLAPVGFGSVRGAVLQRQLGRGKPGAELRGAAERAWLRGQVGDAGGNRTLGGSGAPGWCGDVPLRQRGLRGGKTRSPRGSWGFHL